MVNILSAKNLWSETISPDVHYSGSYRLTNHEYIVTTTANVDSGIYWSPDKLSLHYADMVGVSAKISFEIKADVAMIAYAGFYNNEVNLTTNYQTIEQDIADLSQIVSTIKVYTREAVAHTIYMKNVMIRLASIEDDTYEPYAATNQQLTGLISNSFENGAVNLLENKATSQMSNGITWIVNSDGTVRVSTDSGGATRTTSLIISNSVLTLNGRYKISGCPMGGSNSLYRIAFRVGSGSWQSETGNGVEFDANGTILISIEVVGGTKLTTPIIFKPMITVADMPNSDYDHYVPYAMTNMELTNGIATLLAKAIPTVFYSNQNWSITHTVSRNVLRVSTGIIVTRYNSYVYQRYIDGNIDIAKIGGEGTITATVNTETNEYVFTCSGSEPLVIIGAM